MRASMRAAREGRIDLWFEAWKALGFRVLTAEGVGIDAH